MPTYSNHRTQFHSAAFFHLNTGNLYVMPTITDQLVLNSDRASTGMLVREAIKIRSLNTNYLNTLLIHCRKIKIVCYIFRLILQLISLLNYRIHSLDRIYCESY